MAQAITLGFFQLALNLAVNVKATGWDFGDHYCNSDHDHLNDAEWDALCDEAFNILENLRDSDPLVQKARREWAQAGREFNAEQRAECAAFSCDR